MVHVGPRRGVGLVGAGLFLMIFGGVTTYLYRQKMHEVAGVGLGGLVAVGVGVLLIAAWAVKKPQRVEVTSERISVNEVSGDPASCGVSEVRRERLNKRTFEVFDFTAMGPSGEILSAALYSYEWPALREIHAQMSRSCSEAQARARGRQG